MKSDVNKERFKLIDQMTEDQKDIFLIGMCFYSAFLSMKEKRTGKELNEADEKELSATIAALNRQKLKTPLNKEIRKCPK